MCVGGGGLTVDRGSGEGGGGAGGQARKRLLSLLTSALGATRVTGGRLLLAEVGDTVDIVCGYQSRSGPYSVRPCALLARGGVWGLGLLLQGAVERDMVP